MDRYMTIEEAAACLGMSVRYVRRLVSERRIPFHKYGRSVRLAETDVVAYALANRIEPITAASIWRDLREVA